MTLFAVLNQDGVFRVMRDLQQTHVPFIRDRHRLKYEQWFDGYLRSLDPLSHAAPAMDDDGA
eukprot:gene22716-58427_t